MGQISSPHPSPKSRIHAAGGYHRKVARGAPDDRYQSAEEFKQALLSVRGITSRRRQGEFALAPDSERVSGQNGLNGSLASLQTVFTGMQPRCALHLLGQQLHNFPAPAPADRASCASQAVNLAAPGSLAFTLILAGLIMYSFIQPGLPLPLGLFPKRRDRCGRGCSPTATLPVDTLVVASPTSPATLYHCPVVAHCCQPVSNLSARSSAPSQQPTASLWERRWTDHSPPTAPAPPRSGR